MIFRQLFDSVSSTYTYLFASRHGGEALIIDPVLEKVDRYLDTIAARCEYGAEFRDSRPSYLDGAKHLANSR
jgi:hypothetical protein